METTESPTVRKSKFLTTILPAMILIISAALFVLEQYTDLDPISGFSEMVGLNKTQIVSGKYECNFEREVLDDGVIRSEQTWAYVFDATGEYTAYLNEVKQFSGTWTQSGNTLTILTPAIGDTIPARSSKSIVSKDGNSFRTPEDDLFRRVISDDT